MNFTESKPRRPDPNHSFSHLARSAWITRPILHFKYKPCFTSAIVSCAVRASFPGKISWLVAGFPVIPREALPVVCRLSFMAVVVQQIRLQHALFNHYRPADGNTSP